MREPTSPESLKQVYVYYKKSRLTGVHNVHISSVRLCKLQSIFRNYYVFQRNVCHRSDTSRLFLLQLQGSNVKLLNYEMYDTYVKCWLKTWGMSSRSCHVYNKACVDYNILSCRILSTLYYFHHNHSIGHLRP